MVLITVEELAELAGVSRRTVFRKKIPHADEGYDLTDPVVWEYVTSRTVKKAVTKKIRDYRASLQQGQDDIAAEDLDEELKRKNIALAEERKLKIALENEQTKQILIPFEVAHAWVGFFAAGIRNNFLSLGNRIARGDKTLRDRIETEVARSIQRTIDHAEAGVRKSLKKESAEREEKKAAG